MKESSTVRGFGEMGRRVKNPQSEARETYGRAGWHPVARRTVMNFGAFVGTRGRVRFVRS